MLTVVPARWPGLPVGARSARPGLRPSRAARGVRRLSPLGPDRHPDRHHRQWVQMLANKYVFAKDEDRQHSRDGLGKAGLPNALDD